MAAARSSSQVIDLVSSSEDEDDLQILDRPPRSVPATAFGNPDPHGLPELEPRNAYDAGLEDYGMGTAPGFFPNGIEDDQIFHQDPAERERTRGGGEYQYFGDELVWIPDDSPPPSPVRQASPPVQEGANMRYLDYDNAFPPLAIAPVYNSDTCLQRVLEVFPDVSHEHVLSLYAELGQQQPPMLGPDIYENIVTKLAEADNYPKQGKGKQPAAKRKAESELQNDDFKRWEGPDRRAPLKMLNRPVASALKADFPDVPMKIIAEQLSQHRQQLFQTYVALAAMRDAKDSGWTGRPSAMASADTIVLNTGVPELYDELQAARKRVSAVRAERTIEQARRRAEEENLRRAVEAGETAECQACFDDLPMNRQIHCNGAEAHFTCFDCITTYIKSEVGQSRCGVMCTAGCGSGYPHAQLHLLEDKQLLEKLEQLQQEKDIRDAELDDLSECPFCDYKAILPSIEEDFEFRCLNPDCEKVSCRRCKAASHIPISCEEHAKDHKLNSRHKIEEAMTAALVRKCNKCSKPFIKDFGCNKMSCSSCGNLQCYVCSETVRDYNHFDQNAAGARNVNPAGPSSKRCPLYDNVEERHEREIKEAEAKARAEALEANPDITEEDLKIKESDAVRKATQAKIGQQGGVRGPPGFPGGDYGLFNRGAGLDIDADLDDEDHDDPQFRAAVRRQRARAHARAMMVGRAARANRVGALQAQAGAVRVPNRAGGANAALDNPRGPLGHGLGGHIAGHGAQAHLARPQPVYQGLAHPHPLQAPQLGMPNMVGYMPIYGLQRPDVGQLAQQAPVLPLGNAAPHRYGDAPHGLQAAAADRHLERDHGPGYVLGARNNGLGGQQGLFDAFVEDPFGGGDADPFGFGRIIQGDQAPPRFPEMLAPGQPRNHELGRNAQPELREQHEALAYRTARERQRNALQNMEDRAGGDGTVYELAYADPRRRRRGVFPGAPNAG
ncbi:E3 ubiquitin-protein ligase [Cercospora beticola]|uniref:E3 ubiquitin-protein ligase n=1 Tax=Cercospora beticola TaxID=122368 RepID=A0A2G5H8S1_CERBT|nr:E3 ubiquitin-protein ligase [Cercospora beticola]PIA88930.1 E3 ubiquitin-protein ligase [Cercospora beticola]WPB03365.1 hypothetical protein RHO25_008003 [Cercospora beticola]